MATAAQMASFSNCNREHCQTVLTQPHLAGSTQPIVISRRQYLIRLTYSPPLWPLYYVLHLQLELRQQLRKAVVACRVWRQPAHGGKLRLHLYGRGLLVAMQPLLLMLAATEQWG